MEFSGKGEKYPPFAKYLSPNDPIFPFTLAHSRKSIEVCCIVLTSGFFVICHATKITDEADLEFRIAQRKPSALRPRLPKAQPFVVWNAPCLPLRVSETQGVGHENATVP